MTKEDNKAGEDQNFADLLDKDVFHAPKAGDTVKGVVLSASRAEVRLDIDGILTGIVRGQELYEESGFDVMLVPVSVNGGGLACDGCYDNPEKVPDVFQVIYTKEPQNN